MRSHIRLGVTLAAALAAGAIAAAPARAERIELKNGQRINQCWVLEESKAQVVVAVIRNGNIGKIILDPREVESIDHTRETTLEEALAKARAALEEERKRQEAEAAKAAAAAPTPTAQSTGGSTAGAAGAKKGGGAEKPGVGDLIPPTSPEEEAEIAEAIKGIGDTRRAGGAATRRENSLKVLTNYGLKSVPACTTALEDERNYARMNAARALAEISQIDRRLEIYQEAIPKLIKLCYDPEPWVRVAADRALQAISGQNMGFPEPTGDELSPGETAAIDKWAKWWDEQRPLLTVK